VWPEHPKLPVFRAADHALGFSCRPGHPPRIWSWHVLLVLFTPLASLLSSLLRDDRDRQILALRQQVPIL
jgi:hypothetical protein